MVLLAVACEDQFIDPRQPDPSPDAAVVSQAWPNTCPEGADCERSFCWGTASVVTTSTRSDVSDTGGVPVIDPDGAWLYVSRKLPEWRHSTGALARHVRMRIVGPGQVDPSTAEILPTTATATVGYNGVPSVTRDGLEMVFNSTRGDEAWRDPEVYLSWRASRAAAWSIPRAIEGIGTRMYHDDGVEDPLMLPDGRTLIFTRLDTNRVAQARRVRDELGSVEMVIQTDALASERGYRVLSNNLSCDGWHLLFVRRIADSVGSDMEPRATKILSLDPLLFAADSVPIPLPVGRDRVQKKDGLLSINEAPDCSGVYFSDFDRVYYAPAVACP